MSFNWEKSGFNGEQPEKSAFNSVQSEKKQS